MGYSPQGHKEPDMTEQLTLSLHFLMFQTEISAGISVSQELQDWWPWEQ